MFRFFISLLFIFLFKINFGNAKVISSDSTKKKARFSVYGGVNFFGVYADDKVICPTIGFSYKFSKEKTFIPTIGLGYQKHDLSNIVDDYGHFYSYRISTLITDNLCIPFSMQIHPKGSKYFFIEPTILVCIPLSEKINSYKSNDLWKYDTINGVVSQKWYTITNEINGKYFLGEKNFFTPPIWYYSFSIAGRIPIHKKAIFLKISISKSITYVYYSGYSYQDKKVIFMSFILGYEF